MSAPIIPCTSKMLIQKYVANTTYLQSRSFIILSSYCTNLKKPKHVTLLQRHEVKDIFHCTNTSRRCFDVTKMNISTNLCQQNISNTGWQDILPMSSYQILKMHTTVVNLQQEKLRTCWKCGKQTDLETEMFFCKCGVVQKAETNITYFQLFSLQSAFDIDAKKLSEKYIDLQKNLHPDKFSQASKEERAHAAEQSALVNKAYLILSKPLSRAIYLLEIHNKPIEESSVLSEPEFLAEIMEINEEIAVVSSPKELKKIEEENVEKISVCINGLSNAFNNNNIDTAHSLTVRYQYYANITEKIKELHSSWISWGNTE